MTNPDVYSSAKLFNIVIEKTRCHKPNETLVVSLNVFINYGLVQMIEQFFIPTAQFREQCQIRQLHAQFWIFVTQLLAIFIPKQPIVENNKLVYQIMRTSKFVASKVRETLKSTQQRFVKELCIELLTENSSS